jgi:trehalose-phosphatase
MTRSHSVLLAFDFDGTLAPICDDPSAVQMPRGASALLAEAAESMGVAVAVVSGRDADDLASRIGVSEAYLIGSHGLEIRGPGGVVVVDTPPLHIALEPELAREIALSGLRLEWKKHAIALHWRGIPPAAVAPVVDLFRKWGRTNDLDVIEGRCVVEARCRGGGKETAIRWLASAIGAARVIYAGDDLTDFGALRFAAENGRGVFVASSERTPPPGVTVVESFRELFRLVREEVMI